MFKRVARIVASVAVISGAGTLSARADSCSGRDHTTGTVVGAVGGGVVGSAVTHGSLGGVLVGAAVGGLAGNAISRDMDCHHTRRHRDGEKASLSGVQFYVRDGRHYCWYGDAWNGPGYYWCGYGWRRGYGWGGPYGWHGWHGDNGWHGGRHAWNHGHARYVQDDIGHGGFHD